MKYLVSCCLCFLLVGSIHAQNKSDKPTGITSLKIDKKFIKAFSSLKMDVLTVDSKGVLRPAEGYHIVSNESFFIIKPVGYKVSSQSLAATSQDLPGGAKLRCIGCSACQISVLEGPTGSNYTCAGTCDTMCGAMVQVPKTSIEP